MKRIVSYNADGDLGEEYSEVDVEYDEIPVNVSEYFEEHMNVYDIMTSRHVSSLDIEQVELDTLRKMYETLKNGGDTYGNTDDVAVYMDSLKADIEMYEREEQERNDRVNWLWQLDLKTCPLEEIFKIDYDEVMSFGGELALGVGERLENELKNYLSPTKTGGKI